MKLQSLLLSCVVLVVGCSTTPSQQAPVIEHTGGSGKSATKSPQGSAEKDWRPDRYTVKKGDTLYSIGLEFGQDYKDIAQWNNIQPPYVIHIGRQLRLKDPKGSTPATVAAAPTTTITGKDPNEPVTAPLKSEAVVAAKPLDAPAEPPLFTEPKASKEPYSEQAMKAAPAPVKIVAKAPEKPLDSTKPSEPQKTEPQKVDAEKTEASTEKTAAASDDEDIVWSWPVNGKLLTGFNDAANAKGIDIAGSQGQAVYAAAPGKVVYSGSSLRGYGKLVIIKHNKTYLSAYAHNSNILVKEGQAIAKGQKIAEMGSSDTDRVKLHFEIRKLGKPVDPAKYLPAG